MELLWALKELIPLCRTMSGTLCIIQVSVILHYFSGKKIPEGKYSETLPAIYTILANTQEKTKI